MNKYLISMLIATLTFGCATNNPRIDYINKNSIEIKKYIAEHHKEMSTLSLKINQECYFKVMKNQRNKSYEDISKLALQGIVTYELDREGKILSAVYDSRERSPKKQKCVESVAVGHMLPPSSLKFIYTEFTFDYSK